MRKYTGKNLVFIVGCPRSGTTWLQKLLATHPKVRTGEESHIFSQYVGPQLRFWNTYRVDKGQPKVKRAVGPAAYFRDEEIRSILEDFAAVLLRPMLDRLHDGEIFIEKTPSHALYISEIKELLPESRIINIIRDPRAVVASLVAAARGWGADWAPGDPNAAAKMWIQHVQAVRGLAGTLSSSEFYEVRYEKLWKSPNETLSDLAKFIGLAWNEDAIQEAILNNRPEAIEISGTPIPVYGQAGGQSGSVSKLPTDFVRKARPDSWRVDLSFADKWTLWRVAGRTMKDSGYCWRFTDWL